MKKFVLKLWKNDFFQGGIFFTSAYFVVNLMNYFFNFFAGRSLGPKDFGEITTLFSYLSITVVPATVLSTFIIHKISSSTSNEGLVAKSLEKLFWINLRKIWYLSIPLFLIIPFVGKLTNLSANPALVLIPIIVLSFVSTLYSSTMQGLKFFLLYSLLSILAAALKLTGPLLSIVGVGGLNIIIIFLLISIIIPTLISFYRMRKYFRSVPGKPVVDVQNKILSVLSNPQLLLILFSTLGLTLLNNIDVVFVKKFLSAVDAGIYGSWSLFAKIIFYLLGPLISIGFIFFSSQRKHHVKVFHFSLLLLLAIAIISYFFYSNFGTLIITLLFGSKFIGVLPFLRQASIAGSLYGCIAIINNYFVARKYKEAYILPILMPIYAIFLFTITKSLSSIINLNIFFLSAVTVIYLLSYLRLLLKRVN